MEQANHIHLQEIHLEGNWSARKNLPRAGMEQANQIHLQEIHLGGNRSALKTY